MKSGSLDLLEPSGHIQPYTWIAIPSLHFMGCSRLNEIHSVMLGGTVRRISLIFLHNFYFCKRKSELHRQKSKTLLDHLTFTVCKTFKWLTKTCNGILNQVGLPHYKKLEKFVCIYFKCHSPFSICMLNNDRYRIDNQRSIPSTGMFALLHHNVHSRYEVI